MSRRENEIVETFKNLSENNKKKLLEEQAAAKEAKDKIDKFHENYYIKQAMRERESRTRSHLMEGARDNAFATVLKAIYITALEADTLTDEGLLLAENMVDTWIKENGGANKILSKVGNDSYLLSRITQIVEDAAEDDLDDIEKDESDEKSDEDKKDDKSMAIDAAKQFISGANKDDLKNFMDDLKSVAKDRKDAIQSKDDIKKANEDIKRAQEKIDRANDKAKGTSSDDSSEDISIKDDELESSDDSSDDTDLDLDGLDDSDSELEMDDTDKEASDDDLDDVLDDNDSSDELDDSDEGTDKDADNKDTDSSDDVSIDSSDELDNSDDDSDPLDDDFDLDGLDDSDDDELEDSDSDDLEDSDDDLDLEVDSDDDGLIDDIDEDETGDDEEDITIDGEEDSNDVDDETSHGKIFDELDKEDDVKKAIELIRTRVADAEQKFIKNNAEDKRKIDDLLNKISQNVKTVEDMNDKGDTDKAEIAEESVRMDKRRIDAIRNNRPLTVFECMTRKYSESVLKNDDAKRCYLNESGTIDTGLIIESAKIMYGFLETINTLQLENVNAAYIKKVLENM